jgi:hypothetical protein
MTIINLTKDALWFLNFKNHATYTILVPQYFSNLILVQKFIFVIFSLWLKEKREKSLNSSGKEKSVVNIDLDHQNERYLYQMVLFDEERKNIFEIDLVFEFGLISFY